MKETRLKKNIKAKLVKLILSFFKRLALYCGVLVLVIAVLAPYMWMVSGSFKRTLEIQSADVTNPKLTPTWIPKNITLENYAWINKTVPMLRYLKNSLIMASGTMVFCTLISLFAAYALSRIRFAWKKPYEIGLFATQMFPGVAFLIPYYILFMFFKNITGIPMRNTFHGMILTYASFALPFAVLMLRDFLESIPKEIDEQAEIDGCNKTQIIFKIILPLSLPGIVSVAIYSFIMAWNEMLFAYALTGRETRPVSLGLMDYITLNASYWGQMMAACIVITIPVLILFTLMQKQIVEGYVQSGLKG